MKKGPLPPWQETFSRNLTFSVDQWVTSSFSSSSEVVVIPRFGGKDLGG
jgi:hypothetical protein